MQTIIYVKCTKCKMQKTEENFSQKYGKPRKECKQCANERNHKYYKSEIGLCTLIYNNQKTRSIKKGDHPPRYTKQELTTWITTRPNFKKLYESWGNSNYKKDLTPSVDRLDDYKGYTFDNIRLVTWKENNETNHKREKEGINNKRNKAVVQYSLDGELLREHYSIISAGRKEGVSRQGIIKCCRNKQDSSGGYKWRYKT